MYRYVAMAWDAKNDGAGDAARSISAHLSASGRQAWRLAYQADGVSVWHAGEQIGRIQCYELDGGQGVVLGRLFRKSPGQDQAFHVRMLDRTESARCLASRGRHLTDHYWGQYVAFLFDRDDRRLLALRDPSGAFPCFVTKHQDMEIFFSDMRDVAGLPCLSFSVNFEFLEASAILPKLQKTITGLREVAEVLPAQCVTIGPEGRSSSILWDPYEIAVRDPVADPEAAASLLRTAVQDSVSALAGCYDHILHNIGGLDSSIVLSCIARSPTRPAIECVNFTTASPRGDERRFCRPAAELAKVPLTEVMLDHTKVDLTRLFECDLQASPMAFFDCTALAGDLYSIAKEKRAQALFYGLGGDNVFFQIPYILSALDYVRVGNGSGSISRVTMEAARYGGKSLLYTLRAMAKEWTSPEPCFDYVYNLIAPKTRWPFLNQDLVMAGPRKDVLHPLLVPKTDVPKGKYFHILTSAVLSLEYYDQWNDDLQVERIHPLLAQPVVEACLRVPTWTLVHGGIDRGLARKAFRDHLPPVVARRMSKSSPDELYEAVYRDNLKFIREMLLDGHLVRERILMRAPLEAMLSSEDILERVSPHVALEFLSWEIWVRRWLARSPARA